MAVPLIGALAAGLSLVALLWRSPAHSRFGPPSDRAARPTSVGWIDIASVAALALAAVLRSVVVVVEGGLLIVMVRRLQRLATQRRQRMRDERDLVAVIDDIAVGLRSGQSLGRAFLDAVDTADLPGDHPLRVCETSVRSGRDLVDALSDLPTAQTDTALRSLIVVIRILAVSGGEAEPAVERTGDTLREGIASGEEMQTQARQAIASAVVLSAMPFVFGAMAAALHPELAAFYARSLAGAVCLVGATLLAWAGWEWIDRLVWAPS